MTELTYDYVDQSISPSLECPICRSPLVDPVMPKACQHLFCSSCLHRALDLAPTCPIDRTRIRNRRDDLATAPRVVGDLLNELKIRCTGCKEEMARENWARHEAKCRSAPGPHENGTDVGNDRRDEGTENSKEAAVLRACEHCEEQVQDSDLAAHVGACPSLPRPCRYCHLALPPAQHAGHLLDSCPLVPIPCPHAPFGCAFVGPRDTLPTDHLYSECPYEPLKDCFERFKQKEREWESENWQLRCKVETLEQRLGDVEGFAEDTKHSLGDYLVSGPSGVGSASREDRPPPLAHALSSFSSRTASLSTSLSTLAQSHTDSLHTTQHLVEELNSMRSVIGGMRMQMGDLLRTVQILSSTVRDPFIMADGPGIGVGMEIGGGGRRATMIGRPSFASRRSDSSSDDQDGENPFLHGGGSSGEQYLSSSMSSDPEDELGLFASPPPLAATTTSQRQQTLEGPFSRPVPNPMLPYPRYSRPHRPNGYDYAPGGAGGDWRYSSMFNLRGGGGGPLPPHSFHPGIGLRGTGGGSTTRNGRVVGGIGGGMKL